MYSRRLRLSRSGGNIQLTIPRDLVRHFGLMGGVEFDVHCQGRQITIDLTTAEQTKLFDVQEPITASEEAA